MFDFGMSEVSDGIVLRALVEVHRKTGRRSQARRCRMGRGKYKAYLIRFRDGSFLWHRERVILATLIEVAATEPAP